MVGAGGVSLHIPLGQEPNTRSASLVFSKWSGSVTWGGQTLLCTCPQEALSDG